MSDDGRAGRALAVALPREHEVATGGQRIGLARSVIRRRLQPSGYMYVALAFIYLGVFVLYPMGRTIWYSLTNAVLTSPTSGSFVGLANYRELLSSGQLGQSLYITLMYVLVVTTASMVLGVGCALLLERVKVGRRVLRTALALPWAMPTIATGVFFSIAFDPNVGILNILLGRLHLSPVPWLTSNDVAFWSVCLVTVWTLFPFVMLVSVAALQGVPKVLYDSASIDGASTWAQLRYVTLPTIAPTLRIVTVFEVIWTFQLFQIAYVLTGGGPINGTNFLVINLYKTAFDNQQLGSASAIGVVGLMLAAVVVAIYMLVERRAERVSAR